MKHTLNVMVLAGGPDRERPVSLQSGATVVAGLKAAGHAVLQKDISPQDFSALDDFLAWPGDVILPMLHGSWGEGGGLQQALDHRGLPYVGSRAPAADLAMDKHRSKLAFIEQGLPTPEFQVLCPADAPTLAPPLVLKPLREGSSIDVAICHDAAALQQALGNFQRLGRYDRLLVERFVPGKELTVGVVGGRDGDQALPPIHIVPACSYYDYQAKYTREDTQYRFDIDLPQSVLERAGDLALLAHRALGCRHLSRVDAIADDRHQLWLLEVNTIPGFTSHSLLPKAAAHAGIDLPRLLDRLVRLPLLDRDRCGAAARSREP